MAILVSGKSYGEMVDETGKVLNIEEFDFPRILASSVIFSTENVLTNFLELISNKFIFLSDKIKFIAFKTIKEKMKLKL